MKIKSLKTKILNIIMAIMIIIFSVSFVPVTANAEAGYTDYYIRYGSYTRQSGSEHGLYYVYVKYSIPTFDTDAIKITYLESKNQISDTSSQTTVSEKIKKSSSTSLMISAQTDINCNKNAFSEILRDINELTEYCFEKGSNTRVYNRIFETVRCEIPDFNIMANVNIDNRTIFYFDSMDSQKYNASDKMLFSAEYGGTKYPAYLELKAPDQWNGGKIPIIRFNNLGNYYAKSGTTTFGTADFGQKLAKAGITDTIVTNTTQIQAKQYNKFDFYPTECTVYTIDKGAILQPECHSYDILTYTKILNYKGINAKSDFENSIPYYDRYQEAGLSGTLPTHDTGSVVLTSEVLNSFKYTSTKSGFHFDINPDAKSLELSSDKFRTMINRAYESTYNYRKDNPSYIDINLYESTIKNIISCLKGCSFVYNYRPHNYAVRYKVPSDLKTAITKSSDFTWNITEGDKKVSGTASAKGYNFNGWYLTSSDYTKRAATYSNKANVVSKNEIAATSTGLDLYGKFTPISYKANIKANKSGLVISPSNVVYDIETVKNLTAPKITGGTQGISADILNQGYTFTGYTLNSTGAAITSLGGSESAINLGDVTANFTAKNIKFLLDAGDGRIDKTEVTATFGESVPELPVPTKRGYNFLGWYLENGGVIKKGDLVRYVENTTLTAKYTPKTIKLTYDANGGNVSTKVARVTFGEEIKNLAVPTRDGYDFLGWFYGDKEVKDGDISDFDEDITVVAKWAEAELTVTYDADGGTVDPATFTIKVNAEIPELATPVKEGYDFGGWFYDNKEFKAGETYAYAKDITVKAEWTPTTVTVTYDADGGKVDPASISLTYDELIKGLATPVKAENEFLGWFDGDKEIKDGDISKFTKDTTIKAKWKTEPAGDVKAEDLTKYINASEALTTGEKTSLNEIVKSLTKTDGTVILEKFKTKAAEALNLSAESKKALDQVVADTVAKKDLTKEKEKEAYKTPEGKKAKALKITKLKVKSKKKALNLKWKNIDGVKYQVQVCTNKKFKKSKTKTYTTSKNNYTVKKLKSGKRYFVRVRTIKTVDGVEIYGKWSAVKQKKAK